MQKYLIYLQYQGLGYCGSQKQNKNLEPKQKTIQEELEKVLSTLKKQNISTIFSGRTDAGVSAYSQCAHFVSEEIEDLDKFQYSMNSLLPDDIAVLKIIPVPDDFHAQMSAKYRHYQYKIKMSNVKPIFDSCCFYTRQKLNIERLNNMLSYLVGEHDFSAFKSHSENPATICTLYKASAEQKEDYIYIDIIGNRFLYNMVRTIVGTLLMIEKKNLETSTMLEILNSKDRTKAGMTADPIGLALVEVGYENYK
ncbi:tRNA pseudouridine(38-40) synthase TruA [bacterium]|nr:tRNA pseudouridine(38-40) synthase TruA [bacterium]